MFRCHFSTSSIVIKLPNELNLFELINKVFISGFNDE